MGTPKKPHPVGSAVIPVENKVDDNKGDQPAQGSLGHLKYPEPIQKKVQANNGPAQGQPHQYVDPELGHGATEVPEGIDVVPTKAGQGCLGQHQQPEQR